MGLRSVMVSDSDNRQKWTTSARFSKQRPWILKSYQKSTMSQQTFKNEIEIYVRQVTSTSFAHNAERQKVVETFICMFRHIRSFTKKKKLKSLFCVSFPALMLSTDAVHFLTKLDVKITHHLEASRSSFTTRRIQKSTAL